MILKKNLLIVNFFFLKEQISFIIGSLAIIFCLFQNINVIPFLSKLDTQPYAFLFFLFYILSINKIYIPFLILIISFLILLMLVFVLFLTLNFNWFEYLRVVTIFISFPVIFLGFYNYLIREGFPIRIFFFSNLIWFVNGVFQLNGIDFFSFLIDSRGSFFSGRGVTSFGKEPFIYGLYLIFSMIIYLKNKNYSLRDYDVIFFLLINIFSLFFLCQSMYAIIIFLFCLFLYLINFAFKKNFLKKLIFILFLFFSLFVYIQISNKLNFDKIFNDRIIFFINNIKNKNFDILIYDSSVRERYLNSSKAYVSFFSNKFLPNGVDAVNDSFYDKREQNPNLYNNFQVSSRVWSYVGFYLYYFGFVGLIILFFKFYLISCKKYLLFETPVLLFILLGNIPAGFSFIFLTFALNFLKNEKNNLLRTQRSTKKNI